MGDSWPIRRTDGGESLAMLPRNKRRRFIFALGAFCSMLLLAFPCASVDAKGLPVSGVLASSTKAQGVQALSSKDSLETKAEFAVDLISYLKRKLPHGVASPYADVASTSPQWPYIELALKYGVLTPMTPHVFGAKSSVTGQQVVAAVAHLYGVPTSASFTPGDWVAAAGLMAPENLDAPITHQGVLTFLGTLSGWSLLQEEFPRSWTLSQGAGTALTSAIAAAGSMTTYQMSTTQNRIPSLVLTAAGQIQPAYVKEADDEAASATRTDTVLRASGSGKNLSILTQIRQTSGTRISASLIEYLHANTLHVYSNHRWKTTLLSKATVRQVDSLSDNLMMTGLSHVRAIALENGGYQVFASLTAAAKKQVVLRGLSLAAKFANSPSVISRYLADTTVSYEIDLAPRASWFDIVKEDVDVRVRIPARDFAIMTGQSLSLPLTQEFAKYVLEVDEAVSLKSTVTYTNTVVKAPKGLSSPSNSG